MIFEDFHKCNLAKKADYDSFEFYSSFNKEDQLKLLTVESVYLPELQRFQLSTIQNNHIHIESLSIELQLLILAKIESINFDYEAFVELYSNCTNKDDIRYNSVIRKKLIEFSLISPSVSKNNLVRSEFIKLNEAFLSKDISEMYKFSMQIANSDFRNFNSLEKEIVLKLLKIDSEPVSLAISFSLDEEKIRYGKWEEFWSAVSNYKPGDEINYDSLLHHKAMCIESDYSDERIDMSLFPNLSTIYDEDNSYLYGFASPIDWAKRYESYEIDFILAVAYTLVGESREELINSVNNYIYNHKNIKLNI